MASSASAVADGTEKPGCSTWDPHNMNPNEDTNTPKVMFVVGDDSGDFPTPKENLHSLAVEVEKEGSKTSEAVQECQNIKAYAEESAKEAKRSSAVARGKARRCCSSSAEVQHYRTAADNLRTAARLTSRRLENFCVSLGFAKTAVKLAFMYANGMLSNLETKEAWLIDPEDVGVLQRAKVNARLRTVALKEEEYLVLKAMKRCWEGYSLPSEGEELQEGNADIRTPLIPRDQTDNVPSKWRSITLAVILIITGCIIIILGATLSLNKSSSIAMLTAGAVCTLGSLGYVYKIIKQIIAKRKLAYTHRRNAMLQLIDERLAVLNNFFRTNQLIIPSDEGEEQYPTLRYIRSKIHPLST